MQHYLCGKLIVLLVGVVVVLQIVHFILLNRLEARNLLDKHSPMVLTTNYHSGKEEEKEFTYIAKALKVNLVFDSSREYRIGLLRSQVAPSQEDLTLVTQCSSNHFALLLPLLQRWQGPMSVAVFIESKMLWESVYELALFRANNSIVKQNITFSLVWPATENSEFPNENFSPSTGNRSALIRRFKKNYSGRLPYPNNLLRNVARKAALSKFVFVIDVDMLPSSHLRQDFLQLATRKGWFTKELNQDKTVFVVPAFEGDTIPVDKNDLVKAVERKGVQPFYAQLCWKCQAHTDYDMWLREPMQQMLEPLYEVLWKDPWEPFYIARSSVPFYDERFKEYGFNRISQVCELHVAGYKFLVLNNAFIVHKGFKTAESFHLHKNEELERNRILFRRFKIELKVKYSQSSRRCY